ncbi:methylenetetrahydrofolate reductase C-terminal domain-containing protein, partial [Mesorhizobium japonicum]|uniref:methylenetetrahydrofolate reductase C-terminal domain-containing protein n=1 Tax=Mesorhizobium japonicum TaxID=2066070 RepID=UPI003B5C2A4E
MPGDLLELRTAACPKHMTFGPCGGVAEDGGCEVGGLRCVFLDEATVPWTGPDAAPSERPPLDRLVVADLPARPMDRASLDACADALRGRVGA